MRQEVVHEIDAIEPSLSNVIVHTNQIASIQRMVEGNAAAAIFFDGLLEKNDKIAKIPLKDCAEKRSD